MNKIAPDHLAREAVVYIRQPLGAGIQIQLEKPLTPYETAGARPLPARLRPHRRPPDCDAGRRSRPPARR